MTEQILTNSATTTEPTLGNPPPIPAPSSPPEGIASPAEPQLILGKFKNHDDLTKAYSNLESIMGKKVAQLTPEEAKTLAHLNGLPTKPEDYKLPEGTDEAASQWLREAALKAGITQNGLLEIVNGYNERAKVAADEVRQTFEAKHQQNILDLKREFGGAYDQRIALASKAALNIGGEEFVKRLGDAGLGTDPVVIKALANLGKSLAEDSVPASKHGATFGVTPEDARQQIAMMHSDRETMAIYRDRFHPKNEIVKSEMSKLYEVAYS